MLPADGHGTTVITGVRLHVIPRISEKHDASVFHFNFRACVEQQPSSSSHPPGDDVEFFLDSRFNVHPFAKRVRQLGVDEIADAHPGR